MKSAETTIALAEDNSDQRQVMMGLLAKLGYRVVCAVANGADLVDSCKELRDTVDVALVDLDMPLVDGLEAAEELSKLGIPVVLISGLPDCEHLVIDEEPIVVRLIKPTSIDNLESAIQIALLHRPLRKPK